MPSSSSQTGDQPPVARGRVGMHGGNVVGVRSRYFPLIHLRNRTHPSALHTVKRATGRRRNGISAARRSRPRGSIQMPKPGRIAKTPPIMSKTPTGMRTHRDAGCLSQRRPRPNQGGVSCSKRLKACRKACLLPGIVPYPGSDKPREGKRRVRVNLQSPAVPLS